MRRQTAGRQLYRTRLSLPLLVFLALAGTWLAHNLEYLRVWGPGRFSDALSRSAHTYMGPVGLVLVALAATAVYGTLALGTRLESRLAKLLRALRSAPTSAAPRTVEPADGVESGRELRLATLVGVLWAVQMALYLVQENLEARAVGMPMPGLGALTGVHSGAPLVHLLVAGTVAGIALLTRRRVTELARRVETAARLLAVRDRRTEPGPNPTGARARSWTPLERWGTQRWARPPPVAV